MMRGMGKTKKIGKAPLKPRAMRADGWSNVTTGLGHSTKDKRLGSNYCLDLIDQAVAEVIWRGDDVAGRIVETLPNEMLRQGFDITVAGEKALSEEVDHALEEMGAAEHLQKALQYGRAYGGGAVILGVDDGQAWDKPLREASLRDLKWLNAFTPRELTAERWYAEPLAPRYGEVSEYRLNPIFATQDTSAKSLTAQKIHESRLLRFGATQTSREQVLSGVHPGWDDSIFVRIIQVINDFQSVWQAAGILMQDFAPPVLKMKGLVELLAAAKQNPALSVRNRLEAVEMSRSVARLVLLDKDEEYKRETTNVTGLPDMLDKFMGRLAAAADMPVSLMVGQAPAGLNATGDSEIRWFYDRVAALQRRILKPALRRLVKFIFLSKNGPTKGKVPETWDVKFRPLWQMTDGEMAEVRLKMAQADALYMNPGALLPEEVAQSRFGGDGFSIETQVDLSARAMARRQAVAEAAQGIGESAQQPGDKSIPGTKGTETR
jgi:phage-related protein (TIGR01555 family)